MRGFIVSISIFLLMSCTTFEFTRTTPQENYDNMYRNLMNEDNPIIDYDSDMDGLFNDKEILYGTDPANPDSDNDGLNDYDEITKYLTNPMKQDSDNDGISDFDSEERREYGYTIRAILTVNSQYSTEFMTDHFQDVVIIEDAGNKLTFQITFYEDAYHLLEELPLDDAAQLYKKLDLDRYLQPDPILNFDKELTESTSELFLSPAITTDLDLVKKILTWDRAEVEQPWPGTDWPAPGLFAPPVNYYFYVNSSDEIIFTNNEYEYNESKEYFTHEYQLANLILGKSMFYNKIHGSCGSTSIFFSTILRSLGIPTRTIVTYPIYDKKSDSQRRLLTKMQNPDFRILEKNVSYDHVLVEAFIGNRWLRLDNFLIYENVNITNAGGSFIKTLVFDSWRNVNFTKQIHKEPRPYRLIKLEEQFPTY